MSFAAAVLCTTSMKEPIPHLKLSDADKCNSVIYELWPISSQVICGYLTGEKDRHNCTATWCEGKEPSLLMAHVGGCPSGSFVEAINVTQTGYPCSEDCIMDLCATKNGELTIVHVYTTLVLLWYKLSHISGYYH